MASTEIKAGDLTAVIGDNGAAGEHRAGYNGIWSLRHEAWPRTPFVPAYAGLNLEHIFDGATEFAAGNIFEPRTSPMRLHRRRPRSISPHHMSRMDFQYILPRYEVGKVCAMRGRLCFRPSCTREQVIEEYRSFKSSGE